MISFTLFALIIVAIFILLRLFLIRTALISIVNKCLHCIEDAVHVYQFFKVPEFNENHQENQFYRKVLTYVNSLSSIEDSDFTNLFSGSKSNDIILCLDDNQVVFDTFLGARVSWKNEIDSISRKRTFVLKIKKKDKRRVLQSYLQHIHTVSDEIDQRWREIRLFINTELNQRWRSVPLAHPVTIDTMVMDLDLKNRIKSDVEAFLKSKQYYHRLGRVWKRSYLLYGPSGTGKSSFVVAMAKLLNYDVYDIDLSKVSDDSDLKLLLLQTRPKSLIVVEDLDRFLSDSSAESSVSLSGVLNFMDGIVNSCTGDEKVMVFTMNCKDLIDPVVLRPGRVDVHIYFPLCNFNAFKTLANSYLGVKDHKLFPHVEEIFETGATMSPAEIAELMVMNRSSPSRALKSVITALQISGDARAGKSGQRLSESKSIDEGSMLSWKDVSSPAIKEVRKLYNVLRLKKSGPSDHQLHHNLSLTER
ncbi:hypothetical protein DCAR_0207888 [Daucus carota subsp. sativus]|uniref:Uncharacterized protein n=1 Tax=Daucus carota subsp. sativus TaxID=79200 RepID=A0A161X5E2_DAUCS|nr:PREDICTED: AAA-ATPase At2g46620 [Daucus carota subsp. sativus]WOG88653.1 hypothetical protein DCAR_0207888 [Daucus carota subsp. sativus]